MTRPARTVVAALALAVSAAGTACSGGSGSAGGPAPTTATSPRSADTIAPDGDPTARIVEQLAQEQAKRTPELNVGAASCPDGPPERRPGAVVLCTVEVEGVMVPYTVTFLGSRAESEGGGDNVEFRSAKPMVDVARIVGDIRDQAAVQLQVAPDRLTVDCGPAKVQVVDIGGRITCTVNDGRSTRRLAAVTDDTGNVAINEI